MVDIVTRLGKGSPLTNAEVDANFTNLAEVSGVTGEPMGHEDRTTSTISFNASTRTFTIAPTASSFTVWCKGKKVVVSSAQTVVIPNTTGMHSIYYDANGTLSSKIGYFTFSTEAPTAYVYWNATTGAAPYFGDERHGVVLDWQTHEYLHRTRGAVIANGFLASGYTLNSSATNAATQIAIESGTFFDEDMKIDIVSTATPTAGTYQQNLLFPAKIPVLHLQGTSWVMDAPTDFPFKQGTSRPQYNSLSGGVWSTTDVGNNQHATTWILATNNLTYPVIAIIGQSATDNQGEAEAFSFADLTLTGFPSVEFRPLYKLVYKASDSYVNSVNAELVSIVDLRSISAVGAAANPATDHGNLSGLSDDDHPQYLSVDTVRGSLTAAVKASFLPSQTSNAGKFLQTDGTATSWQALTSGNVTTALGFTPYNATNPSGFITGITSGNVTTALGFTPYNATNPSGYVTTAGARGSISVTGAGSYDSATGVINIVGGVTSFNTRTGAITLSSSDVTTALGFTPYNSTNPNGYLTGITSTQVTTALGYTPYNSSNPSGYITGITSGMVTTALGFTPYNNSNPSGYITSAALSPYLTTASAASTYAPLTGTGATGTWAINISGNAATATTAANYLPLAGGTLTGVTRIQGAGSANPTTADNTDTGILSLRATNALVRLTFGTRNTGNFAGWIQASYDNGGGANGIEPLELNPLGGAVNANGNLVLNSGNYNSYSPTLTGGGASGTWAINITGSAATATDSTKLPLAGGTMTGIINMAGTQTITTAGYAGIEYYNAAGTWQGYIGTENNAGNLRYNARLGTHTWYANSTSIGAWDASSLRVSGSVLTTTGASSWGVYSNTNGSNYSGIWFSTNVGELLLRTADGSLSTRIAADGSYAFINNNNILHAGNYSSYALPLSGGTVAGPVFITGNDNQLIIDATSGPTAGIFLRHNGANKWEIYNSSNAFGLYNYSSGQNELSISAATGVANFRNTPTAGGNAILHAGNYNSYSPTLTGGNASGTWGINITGSAGSISSNGYTLTTGGSEGVSSGWIGFPNGQGIWSSVNGAHLVPNNAGSYGSWYMYGTKGSWHGLHFGSGSTLMMNADTVGFHREGVGWQMRWAAGTGYVHKGAGGGGTEATILDSSNYTSYSPSLSGSYVNINAGGLFSRYSYNAGTEISDATTAYTLSPNYGTTTVAMHGSHGYLGGYATTLTMSGYERYGATQISAKYNATTAALAIRNYNQDVGGWNSWVGIISTANYSSYALPLSGGTLTGGITAPVGTFTNDGSSRVLYLKGSGNIIQFCDADGTFRWENVGRNGTYYIYKGYGTSPGYKFQVDDSGNITINNGATTNVSGALQQSGNQVLHAGNINSYIPSWSTGVNASHIVQRDANGYIYANHINFNTSESENATVNSFITSNGDGWSRKASLAHVKNSIRGVADGTWGIDISGTAANANAIDGVGFTNTASNFGTNADTIESNGISYYTAGVPNFTGNSTDGALYSQAYSGNWQHQIAGDYRSGQIALRGKNSGTWQSWRTVLDASNYTNYAVPQSDVAQNGANKVLKTASNGYFYIQNWIDVAGNGLFSTTTNGAHFLPNPDSFGSWKVIGTRNSYNGLEFASLNNGPVSLMVAVSSNTTGFHNNNYGWQFRWADGTLYCHKNSYGGGTTATVLDSSNYTSYSPSLGGSGASGTWGISITGNSATVGSKASSTFHQRAHFGTQDSRSSGYYKVRILPATSWMLSFIVRIYQGYESYDIRISGYNYGGYYWYSPQASLMDATSTAIDVRFGYDSAYNLWVAFPASNYTGLDVVSVVNGYTQFDGNYADQFAIQYESSLSGTVQTTQTAYRPLKYNENAVSATSASTLQGYSPNQTGGGNTIVQRDGNGYIQNSYFYTSGGGSERNSSGISYFAGFNSGDYYFRSYTAQAAASLLSGATMNIAGNAATATRAAGNFYIDSNYGRGIVGVYSSYRYQGVFAMGDSYKLADDGTTTGSLYGMAWSHPNAGGAAGNLTDHGLLIINNGAFKCAISNSIVASSNITAYSDERLKTNWRDMPEDYVARLAQVKVGIYDRIDEEDVTQVGVSAQSFQKLLPQAIMTAKDEMQTLSVNYGGAALASAVELAKRVVDQEKRIAHLESLINKLIGD